MNQKKNMKLWQLIVLLVLAIAILATMFLPAYHIDSDALKKGMENAQAEEDYYKDDAARDKEIESYAKKFNKEIEREKEENGTDNKSISALKLMTSSLADIRYNGKYDEKHTKSEMGEETYDALNKKHRMTRVLLWLIYGLALAAILITILGYGLKLKKYIPLLNNAAYGVFATAAFAVLRFGTITSVKKETGKLTEKFIGLELHNIDSEKIAPSFLAGAFLIGMAVAIVFLIVSLASMFVGGQEEAGHKEGPYPVDDWDNDWNGSFRGGAGGAGDIREAGSFVDSPGTQQKTVPVQNMEDISPEVIAKAPEAKNGRVRCTKGDTSGVAGYALPQDRKVIVGKSPHKANLVIINNDRVSNIHCSVRYNAETNTYKINDHSTNGTFVNGVRLPKDRAVEYPAGTVLSLADGGAEITLG